MARYSAGIRILVLLAFYLVAMAAGIYARVEVGVQAGLMAFSFVLSLAVAWMYILIVLDKRRSAREGT